MLLRFNAKLQQRIEPESSHLDGETDRESLTPQKDGSEDIENGFIPCKHTRLLLSHHLYCFLEISWLIIAN